MQSKEIRELAELREARTVGEHFTEVATDATRKPPIHLASCPDCGWKDRERRDWQKACDEADRHRDDAKNADLLARDKALYGTSFTDVTGRRIDPNTIRPSSRGSGEC